MTEKEARILIVKVCAALSRTQLVAATDGNISARLGPERVLVTPSGLCKSDARAQDLIICDLDGRKRSGRGEPTTELALHLEAYRARADIAAVVHAHPPLITAFTLVGAEKIFADAILPEVAVQLGPVRTAPFMIPGTRAIALNVAQYLKTSNAVIMARHGAVTVAGDPWAAFLRMEKLEHAAEVFKAAYGLCGSWRRVRRLSLEQLESMRHNYGKGYDWKKITDKR